MDKDKKSDGVGEGSSVSDNPQNTDLNQDLDNQSKSNDDSRMVSWKNHKRALDDMHKFKSKSLELETRLSDLEEEKLREKEQWKQLAEKYKTDADKYKTEAEEKKVLFANTQKFNAVSKIALEAGLLPEALDDLDLLGLDEITVETTDAGRYAVHGAKDFVDKLKTTKPHWFSKPKAPNVNSGGGTNRPNPDKPKTVYDVIQAEKDWKMGKIPREQYVSIYTQYCSQSKQPIIGG